MTRVGRYDAELQMFIEEPGNVGLSVPHLLFLQWLVAKGEFEDDAQPVKPVTTTE